MAKWYPIISFEIKMLQFYVVTSTALFCAIINFDLFRSFSSDKLMELMSPWKMITSELPDKFSVMNINWNVLDVNPQPNDEIS